MKRERESRCVTYAFLITIISHAGESDGDDLAADHHYEALYEVINPGVQHSEAATPDQPEDSFDDSFDSDDAFEEVVVRGLVSVYILLY